MHFAAELRRRGVRNDALSSFQFAMTQFRDELAQRHLAQIVESSDDAIVSKDLNGIIQSWNAAAERMFGYTADEAIGQSIRMIIPDDRQAEEDYVLGQIRAGQAVRHYETLRRRKDGILVPISLSVSPIRDASGSVIGASKIARDVTERTRLQALATEQSVIAQKLSEVGARVASSLERSEVVQKVTDVATTVTQAEFGAFFYNAHDSALRRLVHAACVVRGPEERLRTLPASALDPGFSFHFPWRRNRSPPQRDS